MSTPSTEATTVSYRERVSGVRLANFHYPLVPLSGEEELMGFAEWVFGSRGLRSLVI